MIHYTVADMRDTIACMFTKLGVGNLFTGDLIPTYTRKCFGTIN